MRFIVLLNIIFVSVLLFIGVQHASAQETMMEDPKEMTEMEEMEEMEMKEEDPEGNMIMNQEEGEAEELSEEEIAEILEEAEVLEEEDVENLEDLEGEVVGVTEDEVIIETEEGEVIVVSTEVYEQRRGGGSGSSRRKVEVGEKIETTSLLEIKRDGDNWVITTGNGTLTIPISTPVISNGNKVSVSEIENLEEKSEIVVVTDKDGNVLALEILDDVEMSSSILLVGSIIAVVVIVLLALVLRKKKGASVS